jgi:hypothetical protein
MNVNICYRTKDMPDTKIKVVQKSMTVKEAQIYYDKELKGKVIYCCLRYFDGWHYVIKKVLYDET